jgi:hypothetical protein
LSPLYPATFADSPQFELISNIKLQSSNEMPNPNHQKECFGIHPFVIDLTFGV